MVNINKIIDCKLISEEIKNELKRINKILYKKPVLSVVLVGNNPASEIYIRNKENACEEVGIECIVHRLNSDVSQDELISLINELNEDENINGIIVQMPLPEHIDKEKIIVSINPNKDVDCFHPYNTGLLGKKNSIFSPCTAQACIEILKRSKIDISGKVCVIIGRSDIAGKPIQTLMLNENATTICCHSKTRNLESLTKMADIIICAVGSPKFLTGDMVKEGAVVLDVGINRNQDNKICGDVDFDSVLEKASYITTVPNGVGLITVTMLLKNCLLGLMKQT